MMTPLSEIEYDSTQQALLAELYELGAVLDTVVWHHSVNAGDLYAACRSAVLATIELLGQRLDAKLTYLPPELPRFRIELIPGVEPVGQPVTLDQVLGEGYDLRRQQLRLFSYSYSPGGGVAREIKGGLAHALLDPPYRLRTGFKEPSPEFSQECADLLRRYLNTMLRVSSAVDAQALRCWEWTTDWSTYFEAGHEWWGAYCWTVADSARDTIAVLLASSTD